MLVGNISTVYALGKQVVMAAVCLDGDLLGLVVVSRVLRWWRSGDSKLKDFHFLRVLLCPKRRYGHGICSVALCDGGVGGGVGGEENEK